MTYFDAKFQRCIVTHENATNTFWDQEWEKYKKSVKYPVQLPLYDPYLMLTQKYLPTSSKIIEGGCGLGYHSYLWHLAGYETVALDYAQKTVEYLKQTVPQINPVWGDLRNIPFVENTFDGYWSLGVIEHFWDGYNDLKMEMFRILRNDGVLFLTFPHMSFIRKLKGFLGLYPSYDRIQEPENFYQFFMNEHSVIHDFKSSGFHLVGKYKHGALKGFSDEIPQLGFIIKYLRNGNSLMKRVIRGFFDRSFTFLCSHTIILVFRVKK